MTDVDGRLTTGPVGTYTYGNSSHPHALMATSSGYSADYDAAGNMICRALTSATTCTGPSPTGQLLSYDSAGRLSQWQNLPSSPTATVNYLSNRSGQRVARLRVVNGTTTSTMAYIGSIAMLRLPPLANRTQPRWSFLPEPSVIACQSMFPLDQVA